METDVITISSSDSEDDMSPLKGRVHHNTESTNCSFCTTTLPPGAGIVLEQCFHDFCSDCISGVVNSSISDVIECPVWCEGILTEAEIRWVASPTTFQRLFPSTPISNHTYRRSVIHEPPHIPTRLAQSMWPTRPELSMPNDMTTITKRIDHLNVIDTKFVRCANGNCRLEDYLRNSGVNRGEFSCKKCDVVTCLVCQQTKNFDTSNQPSTSSAQAPQNCTCPRIETNNSAPATALKRDHSPQNAMEVEIDTDSAAVAARKKEKLDLQLKSDWESKWSFVMSSVAEIPSEGGEAAGGEERRGSDDASMLLALSLELEQSDLFHSKLEFECPICLCDVEKGDGVILKDCFHHFCKACLSQVIQHSEGATVFCPHRVEDVVCTFLISDREIKALVTPDFYESFLNRSINQAELAIPNTYHCGTANCNSWWELESDRVEGETLCPLCQKRNCLKCKAVHEEISCREYQMLLQQDQMDIQSKKLLQEKVNRGLVMRCPTCKVMIEKNGGCPSMHCTSCGTGFTWVPKADQQFPQGHDPSAMNTLFIPFAAGHGDKAMSLSKLIPPRKHKPRPVTDMRPTVVLQRIPGITIGPRGGTSNTTLRRLRLLQEQAKRRESEEDIINELLRSRGVQPATSNPGPSTSSSMRMSQQRAEEWVWSAHFGATPPSGPAANVVNNPLGGLSNDPAVPMSRYLVPGASNYPVPGTSNYPVPGTSNYPVPGTSNYSIPGTSSNPMPGTSNYPVPATSNYPVAGTSSMSMPHTPLYWTPPDPSYWNAPADPYSSTLQLASMYNYSQSTTQQVTPGYNLFPENRAATPETSSTSSSSSSGMGVNMLNKHSLNLIGQGFDPTIQRPASHPSGFNSSPYLDDDDDDDDDVDDDLMMEHELMNHIWDNSDSS